MVVFGQQAGKHGVSFIGCKDQAHRCVVVIPLRVGFAGVAVEGQGGVEVPQSDGDVVPAVVPGPGRFWAGPGAFFEVVGGEEFADLNLPAGGICAQQDGVFEQGGGVVA